MNPVELSEKNYHRFCNLEGSEYIASEYALLKILEIVHFFNVKSILEIGLGIGCICDTVLKYAKGTNKILIFYGTEANIFCKNSLKSNVEDYENLFQFESLLEIESGRKFNLLIVDGQDDQLKEIEAFCKPNAMIFIEGDRKPRRDFILSLFPKAKYVQVITLKKNRNYSPFGTSDFIGGGHIIFTNPTAGMTVYWMKEKISTFVMRNVRKIISI